MFQALTKINIVKRLPILDFTPNILSFFSNGLNTGYVFYKIHQFKFFISKR